MKTIDQLNNKTISEIKNVLDNSGIIIFPTDTVWGIGCKYNDKNAVEKIYKIKGRDFNNPLQIIVGSINDYFEYAKDIPENFKLISDNFLPGELTIVLNKSPKIPDFLTANMDTVAIRLPDSEKFLKLVSSIDYPIAATSCNFSGQAPAVTYEEAVQFGKNKADMILNLDIKVSGNASTVIKLEENNLTVIREGNLKIKDIKKVLNGKI